MGKKNTHKQAHYNKGFFEVWLPQVLWWPLACIGAFASASLAYGGTAAAFALLGGTHIFLPLICSAWALLTAYSYLMDHGGKLHKGLTKIGRYFDNPGGTTAFLKKYSGVIAMFAIAIALGLFFAYPPSAIALTIGPQGVVANFLGFHTMTAPVYGGVIAFMAFVVESLLAPIFQGLFCKFKMVVGPKLGYKDIECSNYVPIPVASTATPHTPEQQKINRIKTGIANHYIQLVEQDKVSAPLRRVASENALAAKNATPMVKEINKVDFRLLQQVAHSVKQRCGNEKILKKESSSTEPRRSPTIKFSNR